MKKVCLSLVLILGILIAGCGNTKAPQPVVYSNLTEDSIRYDLNALLQSAGVGDRPRSQFFDSVDQFNGVMPKAWLTEGFAPVAEKKYDPYDMQDTWMAVYPDFLGYNCRITAFSLFAEDFLNLPEKPQTFSGELLEFDLDALQTDPSAFPGGEAQFVNFFAPVPTEPTKDVKVHVKKVQEAWAQRGISFEDDPNIRMINVFFHFQDGDKNVLHIGHSGILLPTPDGNLWFAEKLAFQEPYQVVAFRDRQQLQDYLMEKYDLDQGQPTAKPFIMENDAPMKP